MRARSIWPRLIGIALGTLAVIGFALYALWSFSEYQRADQMSRRNGGWMAAQTDIHYRRLIGSLDRYAMGDPETTRATLGTQLDVFWSCLPRLLEDEEAEGLRVIPGMVGELEAILAALPGIERAIQTLEPGDHAAYRNLRENLEGFAAPLGNLTVAALRATPAAIQMQRDRFGRQLYLLFGVALLLGIALLVLLLRESVRSERRAVLLQAVLDNMQQSLVAFDSERRLIVANRQFAAMAGLPDVGRARGMRLDDVVRLLVGGGAANTRSRDEELRLLAAHSGGGEPATLEWMRAGGRVMEARASAVPPPIGGIVATYTDVTRAKRTERDLIRAKEAAEAANESKSAFLANMSHELRTPLNAILGFSEMMAQELLGPIGQPTYREYAEAVHKSGRHLLALIEDVLDLSKIEAGRMQPREGEVDLAGVIDFVFTTATTGAAQSGVELLRRIAPDLPALIADERMCRQIVLNLVSNALKFTPRGGRIEVSARLLAGGDVEIAVADTGIGIAPEHQAQVLEPFYQVEEAFARTRAGTGLGLPLTRKLAELHGGRLELDSAPGRGTRVRVSFPAARLVRKDRTAA